MNRDKEIVVRWAVYSTAGTADPRPNQVTAYIRVGGREFAYITTSSVARARELVLAELAELLVP